MQYYNLLMGGFLLEIKEVLKELTSAPGISGYESEAAILAEKYFKPLSDEVSIDKFGSVIALKKGEQTGERKKILLAAHWMKLVL